MHKKLTHICKNVNHNVALIRAWRTLLVYTAKNHTLFGSFEIITNQIKEIFGKELKLKNFFPLNSFGPGYKIH